MLAIRVCRGVIIEEECVRKILRTWLPKYAIRVSTIQELRTIDKMEVSLNVLIGKLTAFELSNFDNSQPPKVGNAFKASVALGATLRERGEASTSKYMRELESLYAEEAEQEEVEV